MAAASILVDKYQYTCPICLDLLKDPVTINCGHNFCLVCINESWDQEVQKGIYSCPQCRETFSPRPVLRKNNVMAEVVEKLEKTELQDSSHTEPGDVECDFCTEKKHKAIKSCLTCLVSLCETHLQPHLEHPALKKHELVKASDLQEKICSTHGKPIEVYCRTDQSCICYLCVMDAHKGHDTFSAAAAGAQKQNELKEIQMKCQQRLQEKEKKVQHMKQAVNTIKSAAQTAVVDTERIFSEMICSIEKKSSEVTELIRDQEKAELSRAERLLEQLEKEIADLKKRDSELEQLSHTQDHVFFLQRFQSLCVSSSFEESSDITFSQLFSFDGLRTSLSGLKERLKEFCSKEFASITPHEPQALNDETQLTPGEPSIVVPQPVQKSCTPPPRHGQNQQRRKVIGITSLDNSVSLNKAEHPWKSSKSHRHWGSAPDESVNTQVLFRRVRSILNKLMPHTFQRLIKMTTHLTIDTEERLKGVINLIFEKALIEPHYSEVYANMCRCLMGLKVPMSNDRTATVNFRKLLLNRCQREFEMSDDKTFEQKQKELEAATEEERQGLKAELGEAKNKARLRSLGNIRFFCQLFKLKMLTEPIMHDCIVKLLKEKTEESLEHVCTLFFITGKDLDFEKAKPRMDQYFNLLMKIIEEKTTSPRIRFRLQDVLDLRQNNWVPRVREHGSKFCTCTINAVCILPIMSRSSSSFTERKVDHSGLNKWQQERFKHFNRQSFQEEADRRSHLNHTLAKSLFTSENEDQTQEGNSSRSAKLMGSKKAKSREKVVKQEADPESPALPSHSEEKMIAESTIEENLQTNNPRTESTSKEKFSSEDLSKNLNKLLQQNANNQRIQEWIEANLDEQHVASNQFVRALMTSVCHSAIKVEEKSLVNAQQMATRVKLLQRYLSDEEKQLEALYALQALVVQLGQPANLLRMFFDVLYDEDVIIEEAFFKWESSHNPAEQNGKLVALKSTVAFFTWLREAEDESDIEVLN